jgi:hypothetical protein
MSIFKDKFNPDYWLKFSDQKTGFAWSFMFFSNFLENKSQKQNLLGVIFSLQICLEKFDKFY